MKRILTMLIIIVCILSLAGCSLPQKPPYSGDNENSDGNGTQGGSEDKDNASNDTGDGESNDNNHDSINGGEVNKPGDDVADGESNSDDTDDNEPDNGSDSDGIGDNNTDGGDDTVDSDGGNTPDDPDLDNPNEEDPNGGNISGGDNLGQNGENQGGEVPPTDDEEDTDYGTATVYYPGDDVYFVGTSDERKMLSGLINGLTDNGINVMTSTGEVKKEILVGRTGRAESNVAYQLLEMQERKSYFNQRYLVYASEGKVAIAYDENEYTPICLLEYINDALVDQIISQDGYVGLAKGVVSSGTIDLIAEQKKLDEISLEKKWADIKANTTPQIYEAFRRLYTLYDDELISWYAHLYDPRVGGYYSNTSGMLNDGFVPCAETTNQALNFLVSSGMLDGLGSFEVNIPKIMRHKIVYFLKSMQDPNGYFYNPSVSKTTMDTSAVGGRGRDLSWCTNLLKAFGSAPVYDTPNGHKGDGMSADEYWASLGLGLEPPVNLVALKNQTLNKTAALSSSVDERISKVVLASSTKDVMSDYKTFIDYLYSLDVDTNPYSNCGQINSTYGEIAHKSDNLLKKQGRFSYAPLDGERYRMYDGMTLKEITIAYFNSKINPDTGLCGLPSAAKPSGTEFLYTNGFFKIIPVYNSWKVAYPEPMKAAEALLKGIVSDEPSLTNICDVYNVWSALSALKSNVRNYCDPTTRDSVMKTINGYLEEYAADAITVSYQKMSGYKRPDGGFSSSTKSSLTKMFGVIPIGTGVIESNVDAIGKPTHGMVGPMFSLLGLSKVPMYTRHHLMQYYEIILAEENPEKTYFVPRSEILTFDNMPNSSEMSVRTSSSDISVEDIGANNSALKILKNSNSTQTVIDFTLNKTVEDATSVVFETDLKISDVQKSELIAFVLGPKAAGHNNRAYRFALSYSGQNGSKIKIREEQWTGSGSTFTAINTVNTNAEVGKWFKLKIVYDTSDIASSGSPVTKVYVDGQLVLTTREVYSAAMNAYDDRAAIALIMFTQLKSTLWMDNTSLKQMK